MTKKIIIALALLAFIASGIGFAVSADTTKNKASQLALLLPESDGVAVLNSDKFLSVALPQILSANQPMLTKVNSKIDELKGKTGLDLRQFSEVAVGLKTKQTVTNKIEMEPVILARGTMDSKALVAVAKLASNGKYKTEKVGSRTVYIFSPKEVVEKNKPKDKSNNVFDKGIDAMFKQFSKEVALTAFDSSTIAIGSVSRVKETISNSPRISNEVLNLLSREQTAVINMGMVMPNGLSQYVGLDNDELGTNLDAIRQVQGSMDVVGNTTSVSIMAKTLQNTQAESLEEMLMGLQMVGKGLLGGMKGNDKQVYSKMVENMQISREANQVMLNLNVPQSDIDVIIGKK